MTPELTHLRAQVEAALDQRLPTQSDIAQPVLDAMRHAVLGGGKRLRPMLVCAASEACGGRVEDAMDCASAIEFIHAYSLIHDDLPAMDDDELRHGLPAAHVAFGEANAILAGDSLHSLAFQTIADSTAHSAERRLKIITLLSDAAGWAGMAGGQCLDIEAEGEVLGLERLHALHAAKTGALIRVAVQIGALCAQEEPDKATFAALTAIGDRIGLAFQVMDDVLDVTQSTDKLGKPAGSDEALDKNTFPKLMGLDAAKQYAHELVQQAHALLKTHQLQGNRLEALVNLVVERDH